ncbi:MAG: histidine kinase [Flavobacteriaceae bacterium]|nr:MAG: histidine kinase [Flavobacteriaceae bacterium]
MTYIISFIKPFKTYAVLITTILLIVGQGYSQTNVRDSLKNRIENYRSEKSFTVKDTAYIDLLNKLGNKLRYYKVDSLLLLSQQALKYSRAAKYERGESQSLVLLGDFYSDQGKHSKAVNHYRSALVISNNMDFSELTIRIQNNLAGQYGYMGDYAKALNVYLISIEYAERIGDIEMLSIMNENIASLYASQKDYNQSLVFYKKVKKINDEIGNEVYSAETMSNMASTYADMGNLEYAMFNINKSISIFEKHDIIDWLAYAYEVKGKTYLKQKKYKWALHWYNQGEMLHEKIEDDRGKIDLINGMAEAYHGLKKDSISEIYALEAFQISNRMQFKEGKKKCAKTLYQINKNKEDYATAIKYLEIYQSLSDTLSRNENQKSLTMLKTKIAHDVQKEALMVSNKKALAKQRGYIYGAGIILLILCLVTFLIYRNEKIQKKLNAELQSKKIALEKREEELSEINETKDKLFSIIGHDLRGPIGALQGLLKMYVEGDVKKSEFLSFIPRLHEDVNHISFTLNNLLSWGQTQMKGTITRPTKISIKTIVADNINLLSKGANNKSIRIVNRIPENTLAWSDSNQIDIVIRNLISNALKFTPENGMITIEAQSKKEDWLISVKDTGIGMDKETQEKLFEKSSNFTTHGTNNEKGTGLGLSLCKEMIENNKGTIWVDSIIRKGTNFHFTLPKAVDNFKKAV